MVELSPSTRWQGLDRAPATPRGPPFWAAREGRAFVMRRDVCGACRGRPSRAAGWQRSRVGARGARASRLRAEIKARPVRCPNIKKSFEKVVDRCARRAPRDTPKDMHTMFMKIPKDTSKDSRGASLSSASLSSMSLPRIEARTLTGTTYISHTHTHTKLSCFTRSLTLLRRVLPKEILFLFCLENITSNKVFTHTQRPATYSGMLLSA